MFVFLFAQSKTLLKFVQCELALECKELQALLDPLLRDKSTGVASQSSQAWQEITNVISIFRQFGAKEQVTGQMCKSLSCDMVRSLSCDMVSLFAM